MGLDRPAVTTFPVLFNVMVWTFSAIFMFLVEYAQAALRPCQNKPILLEQGSRVVSVLLSLRAEEIRNHTSFNVSASVFQGVSPPVNFPSDSFPLWELGSKEAFVVAQST